VLVAAVLVGYLVRPTGAAAKPETEAAIAAGAS
jgi:hypothetical protein